MNHEHLLEEMIEERNTTHTRAHELYWDAWYINGAPEHLEKR